MKYSSRNSKIYANLFEHISKKRKKGDIFYSEGRLFASWCGQTCEKQLRYNFDGVEKIIDDPWPGHEAQIGNAVHEEIQKDMELAFGEDVEIEQYYPITIAGVRINCKIDAILNGDTVIEMKSCKDSDGREPKPEHYQQLQFYMGVTGIKKGVLSYFKRSNGRHRNSFTVDFDPDVYATILDKYERIVNNENLKVDQTSCRFCPYVHLCEDAK